jgi:Predicted nucleotide-binding protein containing TIR-like domain
MSEVDNKKVFVVHGRNDVARREMFAFLRAIGLQPIEWSEALHATGSASPFIGDVLDTAFGMAQAVVVLMTPDEVAYLLPAYRHGNDDPEGEAKPQARPNVLFEAGMAMGRDARRTVLVELGAMRPFSDVAGRHAVRLAPTPEKRKDLAQRLRTAGCDVNLDGDDWLHTGDFTAPEVPDGPVGRRVPSNTKRSNKHLDAKFLSRGSGPDYIQLINIGSEDLFDLTSPNENELYGRLQGLPLRRLPVGKSKNLSTLLAGGSPDTFDLIVNGRTESGETFSESLYLDLDG